MDMTSDLSPMSWPFYLAVLKIIWIDILLSGDNAVVIAMACRSLPERQRKLGIWLGAGAAVGLRIVFALLITYLLQVPFLKVVGAILLFKIAVSLVTGDDEEEADVESSDSLWNAVWTIVVADAVMSIDNVVAIAGASQGHPVLFIIGLLFSIPLVVFGATMIVNLLTRYPIIVWAGGALLGWVAGEMFVTDPLFLNQVGPYLVPYVGEHVEEALLYPAAALGAIIVVALGYWLKKRARSRARDRAADAAPADRRG